MPRQRSLTDRNGEEAAPVMSFGAALAGASQLRGLRQGATRFVVEPPTTPIPLVRAPRVFVDSSGRREQRVQRLGWLAAALCVASVGVVAVTVATNMSSQQNVSVVNPAPAAPSTTVAQPSPAHAPVVSRPVPKPKPKPTPTVKPSAVTPTPALPSLQPPVAQSAR